MRPNFTLESPDYRMGSRGRKQFFGMELGTVNCRRKKIRTRSNQIQKMIVTVENGFISVEDVPPNVEVHDYDIEGQEETDHDEEGRPCNHTVHLEAIVDSDGCLKKNETIFLNHYRCEDCDQDWSLESDSMHDDECAGCGKAYRPVRSEEVRS